MVRTPSSHPEVSPSVRAPASALEIARTFASKLAFDDVIRSAGDLVRAFFSPKRFTLALCDRASGAFVVRADEHGDDSERIGRSIDTESELRQRALAARKREVGRVRPEASGPGSAIERTDPTETVVVCPMVVLDEVVGLIELVDPFSGGSEHCAGEPGGWTLLDTIAEFGALAVVNAEHCDELRRLGIVDELTGLFNASHLKRTMAAELQRARRFEHPLSVLFLDLDHFKLVNDRRGHLVGSELLGEVGKLLRENIRQIDFGFRYGGDEFALVLVETAYDGACVVASRIVERLRASSFFSERGYSIQITASIGVASFPEDGASTSDLLNAADMAMYRAKELGRDEIVAARDLPNTATFRSRSW